MDEFERMIAAGTTREAPTTSHGVIVAAIDKNGM